jgi:hypothetical protein
MVGGIYLGDVMSEHDHEVDELDRLLDQIEAEVDALLTEILLLADESVMH